MVKKREKEAKIKTLDVVVDRRGDISIDYSKVKTDEDLLLYKGFSFKFYPACWLVTQDQVNCAKIRFRKLGLIP